VFFRFCDLYKRGQQKVAIKEIVDITRHNNLQYKDDYKTLVVEQNANQMTLKSCTAVK